MSKKEIFQEVYPFTTESIAPYFNELNLKDKDILTVGSSLDQAFNALLLGAKNITVYDINKNTEEFYKIKKDIILNNDLKSVYHAVLDDTRIPYSTDVFGPKALSKMNNYMQDEESYQKLQSLLENDSISFINGSIFEMDTDKTFDRMIFSNVLQYLDTFKGDKDAYLFLRENFLNWKEHLNDDGILQLLYLYSFSKSDMHHNNNKTSTHNLGKVCDALDPDVLSINFFADGISDREDAIVLYKKRRR